MCKLVLKLRKTGHKNHKFTKIIIVPNNYRTGGRFSCKLGYGIVVLKCLLKNTNLIHIIHDKYHF